MIQTPSEPGKKISTVPTMALTPMIIGGEVGCLTLFIVVLALLAGLGLDKLLDTKPVFTITLLLGSAPFSLFLTFWLAMRSIKRMTSPQIPGAGQVQTVNKEDDGE